MSSIEFLRTNLFRSRLPGIRNFRNFCSEDCVDEKKGLILGVYEGENDEPALQRQQQNIVITIISSWRKVNRLNKKNSHVSMKILDFLCNSKHHQVVRKLGWEVDETKTHENKGQEEKGRSAASNQNTSYGAWGPKFKNKDHFASLHHC